mmetsp:Transcript_9812/g.24914  ORF Transcript_9812/g.24914 Transcript_9812/m.24914 type:complete len:466 (+) Transcript_9812:223-1620(+)
MRRGREKKHNNRHQAAAASSSVGAGDEGALVGDGGVDEEGDEGEAGDGGVGLDGGLGRRGVGVGGFVGGGGSMTNFPEAPEELAEEHDDVAADLEAVDGLVVEDPGDGDGEEALDVAGEHVGEGREFPDDSDLDEVEGKGDAAVGDEEADGDALDLEGGISPLADKGDEGEADGRGGAEEIEGGDGVELDALLARVGAEGRVEHELLADEVAGVGGVGDHHEDKADGAPAGDLRLGDRGDDDRAEDDREVEDRRPGDDLKAGDGEEDVDGDGLGGFEELDVADGEVGIDGVRAVEVKGIEDGEGHADRQVQLEGHADLARVGEAAEDADVRRHRAEDHLGHGQRRREGPGLEDVGVHVHDADGRRHVRGDEEAALEVRRHLPGPRDEGPRRRRLFDFLHHQLGPEPPLRVLGLDARPRRQPPRVRLERRQLDLHDGEAHRRHRQQAQDHAHREVQRRHRQGRPRR